MNVPVAVLYLHVHLECVGKQRHWPRFGRSDKGQFCLSNTLVAVKGQNLQVFSEVKKFSWKTSFSSRSSGVRRVTTGQWDSDLGKSTLLPEHRQVLRTQSQSPFSPWSHWILVMNSSRTRPQWQRTEILCTLNLDLSGDVQIENQECCLQKIHTFVTHVFVKIRWLVAASHIFSPKLSGILAIKEPVT